MKKALILAVMLAAVPALGFSQTTYTVNNVAGWVDAVNGIRNGGNNQKYTITVTGTVSVPAGSSFGSVTGITVSIEGSGTLTLSNNGSLLEIGGGQTVIAKDVTLRGRDGNTAALVVVTEGAFRMEGNASVTANKARTNEYGTSGGVHVGRRLSETGRGTFTMQDNASVTGNSGGGVHIGETGTFTMSGGAVSGNEGSGVIVDYDGTFTMSGGTISGNTASVSGGGVCVFTQDGAGTFTMEGGTVSGNTAAVSGGGVYIRSKINYFGGVARGIGTFAMKGGTVSGNAADTGGGVYMVGNGTTFTNAGGTVHGDGAEQNLKNIATSGKGHAVYGAGNQSWRNASVGPAMNPDAYGFWLNEEPTPVVLPDRFPLNFIQTWKRRDYNNTLDFTATTVQSSSRGDNGWNVVSVSGNIYTIEDNISAKTRKKLTIKRGHDDSLGDYIDIDGDKGKEENNWNGRWWKKGSFYFR